MLWRDKQVAEVGNVNVTLAYTLLCNFGNQSVMSTCLVLGTMNNSHSWSFRRKNIYILKMYLLSELERERLIDWERFLKYLQCLGSKQGSQHLSLYELCRYCWGHEDQWSCKFLHSLVDFGLLTFISGLEKDAGVFNCITVHFAGQFYQPCLTYFADLFGTHDVAIIYWLADLLITLWWHFLVISLHWSLSHLIIT